VLFIGVLKEAMSQWGSLGGIPIVCNDESKSLTTYLAKGTLETGSAPGMLVGLESTISNEGRYNLTELRERVEDCIFVKLWKM
jgi:hypothetical protein